MAEDAHQTEHHHGREVIRALAPEARALRHQIPEVYAGFVQLADAAMAPGALDRRTKELLALVQAITLRCDGCIATHARAAATAGATREEVAEAIGTTFLMNGGPGTVYGPRAYDAFCEFLEAIEAKGAETPGA
ncbi:MAG: carboxymuconolactone decarboxylase family protein [Actinobacteria bacterium]|nr:carboxymuconolactone decarboxylase family protein [Actinomycetota bacterium]